MNNVKKLLVSVFACSFAVLGAVAGAGCKGVHEHDWDEWTVVTPATCTEEGLERRVCKDDPSHIQERKIDALSHAYGEWTVTTAATCVSEGVETRVCANNSDHIETRTVPVEQHSWGEWTETSAATCVSKKVEERVCSFNEHTETREVGDFADHDWNDWVVTAVATCTQKAVETRTCKNDPEHKETRETGEAKGHAYGEWTVTTPSTCVTAGVETRVCANDETHTETRALALAAHSWDEGTVTTAPTEYEAGIKTYTCTVEGCGETKEEPIPELGHTHDFDVDWSFDADSHWKECSGIVCGEKSQIASHDWNDGEITKPATCTADGVKTYTCKVCGKTKTQPIEKLDHDWSSWEITAPTEAEEGKAERTCGRDGCEEKQIKILPVLTDDSYDKELLKAATCTEQGKMNFKVTVEGVLFDFDVIIPITEHSPEKTEVKPATCTEGGNTAYWTCEECGKIFLDSQCTTQTNSQEVVIPATGHKNLVKTDASASSCIENGNSEYWTCTDCNKLFSDEQAENQTTLVQVTLPLGSHSLEFVEEEAATCTQNGCAEYWYCSVCNAKFSDPDGENKAEPDVIPSTGHISADVATQYAATDTTGRLVWECTVCHNELEAVEYQGFSSNGVLAGATVVVGKTYYISRTATSVGTSSVGAQNIIFSDEGTYQINIKYIDETIYQVPTNARGLTVNNKALFSGNQENGYTVVAAYADSVKAEFDCLNRLTKLSVKIDGNVFAAGNKTNIVLTKSFEEGETSGILLSVTAKLAGKVSYGDNVIEITEAEAMADTSTDTYIFTPADTQIYSITVPAGVTVVMNGKDLIIGNERAAFANFAATADAPIQFTFIGNKVAEYTVTIGEERAQILTLDNEVSFNIVAGKAIGVELGAITEGTYNIELSGAFIISKQTGCGTMYMSLNSENDKLSVKENGLYLRSTSAVIENENLSANCSVTPWVVTATLKEGDMLYFTSDPAWGSMVPDGKDLGQLFIALKAVD